MAGNDVFPCPVAWCVAGLTWRAQQSPPCGRGRTPAQTLEAGTSADAASLPYVCVFVCGYWMPEWRCPNFCQTSLGKITSQWNGLSIFRPVALELWRHLEVDEMQPFHASPTECPEHPAHALLPYHARHLLGDAPARKPSWILSTLMFSCIPAAFDSAASEGSSCFPNRILKLAFCTLLRVDNIYLLLLTHTCTGVSDDRANFKNAECLYWSLKGAHCKGSGGGVRLVDTRTQQSEWCCWISVV